jgi:predicted DNA-binding protein (UPF0251 family)
MTMPMMQLPDPEPGMRGGPEGIPELALPEELETVEAEELEEDGEDEGSSAEEYLPAAECDPELWLYRDRTVALLRRYLRYSVEVGRLPSLLGREFFRTRVSSYRVGTFEDAVIFVHDVEKCLEKLDQFERELIAKMVLQDYTQYEAARLMGCWRRTIGRRFPEALDRLSEAFLRGGLLVRLPGRNPAAKKSCQEGEMDENSLSDS